MELIRQYRVWLTEIKRYILSHVSAVPSVLQSMAIYRNFCLPRRHRGATIYRNSCLPRRYRGTTIYWNSSPEAPQGSYDSHSTINSMPSLNLSLLNLDWGVTYFPWQILANVYVALCDRVSLYVVGELQLYSKASSPLCPCCVRNRVSCVIEGLGCSMS